MKIDYTLHKNLMLQILKDIYTDTSISPFLGFKGGTAAYFIYNLERFSTDLDFDLLDAAQAEHIYDKVLTILNSYGVVKDARKKRFNLFFLLSYAERARNIKVEINLRNFGSRYEPKKYFGIPMLVMCREDMFAHKLVAMHERLGKTNRDIYDVWFFLKNNWPINNLIVEQRTNMPFHKFIHQCISALKKLPDRSILSGVGELLDEKRRTWAKNNLRSDTVFLLNLLLEK